LGEIWNNSGSISVKENSSPLQYKIGDQTVELGKEFTLKTPAHGTILDIKDINGEIKGEIEFIQHTESTLTPTLNLVTLNVDNTTVDFSSVMTYLNSIYNTMNVYWQTGKEIKLETGLKENELNHIYDDDNVRTTIFTKLTGYSDYKENQYYMIIAPTLSTGLDGFGPADLKDNWFFAEMGFAEYIPSHELGHCNGLDEFSVNIGATTSANANDVNSVQRKGTNVMSYGVLKKDFFSWQIPVIRDRINEQLNKQ
jgi:hypothetical protein